MRSLITVTNTTINRRLPRDELVLGHRVDQVKVISLYARSIISACFRDNNRTSVVNDSIDENKKSLFTGIDLSSSRIFTSALVKARHRDHAHA